MRRACMYGLHRPRHMQKLLPWQELNRCSLTYAFYCFYFPSIKYTHPNPKMVKKSGLDDLEYAMPKEYREDAYRAPIAHSNGHEACCFCGRTSDEAVLVPAVYCGREQWVCGRCLMSPESHESSEQPIFDDPTSTEQTPSSMSMFDRD